MPGQYRIYRVANSTTVFSPSCGAPSDSEAQDTSTFRTGVTFAIFAADTKVYFMEFGEVVLEGDREGSDYAFSGTDVDVEPSSDNTVTTTHTVSVDVTIKGKKISGTATDDLRVTCMGNNCPEGSMCTATTDFEGSEIKDVELQHPV